MDSFIIAALALCSLTAPACGDKGTSKARSCSDIRQFYSGKGFSLDGVPQSEISGEIFFFLIDHIFTISCGPKHTFQPHLSTFSQFFLFKMLPHTVQHTVTHTVAINSLPLRSIIPLQVPPRNVRLFWGQSRTCSSTIYCVSVAVYI